MEVVIDYEYLNGNGNELVVKELAIAAKNVVQTFHFKPPYPMHPHCSEENGLNWADGIIPYTELFTVLNEATANYMHVYSYGTSKCAFLSNMLKRPVKNLEDFKCPTSDNFVPDCHCWLTCHKFPNIRCATESAQSYYTWLNFHMRKKSYVKCPKEHTRHTAEFLTAI